MNIDNIKKEFPIFDEKIQNNDLVYLDSANSSQKPKVVIDRINEFYTKEFSNVGRSIHYLAVAATNLYENTRSSVQKYINAKDKNEIVFTKGATILKTKYLVLFFSIVVFIFGAYLLLQQENSNKIKPSFGFFSKAILGFISGSISAPMGITGAMMNVPILRFFGYPITKAIGSAAAIGWVISISGTIGFFSTGLYLDVSLPLSIGFVNIPAFLIFIPITTIMARIGVNTVHKMSKIKAQRMFGVFLYVIGTIFIFRYFSL